MTLLKALLKREAKPRRLNRTKPLPYLLILPALSLFLLFTYYPFLKAIYLSFTVTSKQGNPTKWVGLANWIRVLGKANFWQIVKVTLKMAALNLV